MDNNTHRLASSWSTERLAIRDGALAEAARLQEVFNACAYVGRWDKTFREEPLAVFVELVSKSLGLLENPDGRFRLQSIYQQDTGELVGYFHLTHGMPKPHVVWISMFVIHPAYQKHRFGQEVTDGLWAQLRALGEYSAVWLDVYLKNWPALRFWLNNGFNTILDYDGDKIHAEDTYANIALEKKLM